jgi:NAD(P)-dependent dehydrogenase (short-subunit alcohol dehydrogenase family)
MSTLQDRTVLVVGRGSGIARGVVLAARDAGARVVAAGRNPDALAAAYAAETGISVETLDHIVSTASARARGRLQDLQRDAVRASFDTKVIGPLMLAKHLGPRINEGGSLVLFSGAAAFKIAVGTLAVAITNGAADTLTRSLAVELAPIRVIAISPGVIDTGAWDALGETAKAELFADQGGRNPAGRIGTPDDIADAVLFALTNTVLTGVTLAVDGGELLT